MFTTTTRLRPIFIRCLNLFRPIAFVRWLIRFSHYNKRRLRSSRFLLAFILFISVTCVYVSYYSSSYGFYLLYGYKQRNIPQANPPIVDYVCERRNGIEVDNGQEKTVAESVAYPKTEPKILLLVETQYTSLGQQMCGVLDSMRIQYKAQTLSKSLPPLTNNGGDKGRYAVLVFENLYKYLNLDKWHRRTIDKYCRDYGASILAFMPSRPDYRFDKAKVRGFPLLIRQNLRVQNARLNSNTNLYYITRPGPITDSSINAKTDWVGFDFHHSTYESVLDVDIAPSVEENSTVTYRRSNLDVKKRLSVCLLDHGHVDGIRRLYFGNDFGAFWLLKLLFVDGLRYLSHGLLSISLVRYLQVDIDDIFVGEKNKKMTSYDVKELIASQNRLRRSVPNFTFNLGFSGKFFRRGGWYEEQGDQMLVVSSKNFWWFSHSWSHTQAHHKNYTDLSDDLFRNRVFAEEHNIPVRWSYSVAPHHSGVYPVHDPLYKAWRNVWNVTVTSTEEYPHLKPASQRRGFVHKHIQVLPRQTCGLYTHTIFLSNYSGGKARLDQSIKGGDLFYTFVLNPFLVFMTHQTNYAGDRLALYTFETAVRFLQCWTNLRLKTIPPVLMAEKYFRRYPEERDPIWGNPCNDKRHLVRWSSEKSCEQLPKAVIIGPQKTGTTALYKFLKLHPQVCSNTGSAKTFEEIQFFNGRNYKRGIDWYMNFFPLGNNESGVYFFEKSATYFDSDSAPKRLHALIPTAKLITILVDPAIRAYSWYQHMKAHDDDAAANLDFLNVLKSTEESNKSLYSLKHRCLYPGHYAQHIERWLTYFPAKKLLILNGETLKTDPADAMRSTQNFLDLKVLVNYSEILRYSPKKGFFCALEKNRTSCLGGGKGRKYEPMSEESKRWLAVYFRSHNVALRKLLNRLGYSTPQWLHRELQLKL